MEPDEKTKLEKRIAELEEQLADQKRRADNAERDLANYLRNMEEEREEAIYHQWVRFHRRPWWERLVNTPPPNPYGER